MKKLLLLLAVFLLTALPAFSERVPVQTAQRVAQSFLNSKMDDSPEIHLIDFAEKNALSNFYVFGNEHCFVIIAADDAVHPVLGYSTENGFGTEMMPKNVEGWMMAYNEDVALVVNNRVEATADIREEWDCLLNGLGLQLKTRTSVEPLVRTKWNQTAPFNNLCPADPECDTLSYNGRTPTGCMATAMAQVLNYWEHPVRGVGSNSYIPSAHPEYGPQQANFGATVYDWDNMKNDYSHGYTNDEANAVATLMYHCGVAVNMDYTPTGSGGNYDTACMALKSYFNFNPNMRVEKKSYITIYGDEYVIYTDEEWKTMLKGELDLCRPICYKGGYYSPNASGTHAFVCDGYDEYDMFHFNWGWGGNSDGYYAIGAINTGSNPDQQWNQWNAAYFDCFPVTPSINPPSGISTIVNGRDVSVQWNSVSNASSYKLYRDGDLVASNLTSTNYTDSNLVYGTYSYYVKSVKSDGTMSLRSDVSVAEVHYPGPVPTNLQASVNNHNVALSWTTPIPGNTVMHYGEGTCVSHCGYGDRDTYWAQRYPAPLLSDNVAGMAINRVSVYRSSTYSLNSITITAYIYSGDSYGPEELLYQTDATLDNSGWQNIDLSTPVVIDYYNDLWVVLRAASTEGSPAAYCDYTGPGSEDALYLSADGGVTFWRWDNNWSWMIKVYATDGTYNYNLYRDGAVVANSLTGSTYTDNNLPDGFYDYHVTTNYFGGESDPSNTVHVQVGNPTYNINATANPTSGGTVTGGGTYNYNQSCTVTASANTGYTFTNWTENGNVVSDNASYTFTVTSNRNLVAHFQLQTYAITVSADPSNGGTATGSGTYNYGQSCTVTATPNTGYNFINWTENGNVVSTDADYTFTVTSNCNLVAHFQLQSYTITVSADPSDGGSVTGGGTYNYGQGCTVTATPNTGYNFINWTENGSVVSTNASYTFTVTGNRNLVAHFQLQTYTVTVSADPSDGGTVTGGGTYNYGQICTVTATPGTGYNFINWTENGNPVSNETPYSFTVTSDRNLVAHFTTQSYVITAIADPIEGGTVTGAGGYNYGETCTLTATANAGYTFQRWTRNGTQVSTDSTYAFTVTGSATYIAHFAAQSYTVTVSAEPAEGGTVSGGGTYTYGQTCTVHATADACYNFINWTENGNMVSTSENYTFTVTGDRNLVANFRIKTYEITAEANPEGAGVVTGAGTYQCGETCILNAVPNENYIFLNWTESGNIITTQSTIQIPVTESRHFVANFSYYDGIGEKAQSIEVYPNPVKDILTIKGEGIRRVTVINMVGQVMEDRETEGMDGIQIHVQGYSSGLYVLRLMTEGGVVIKHFIYI